MTQFLFVVISDAFRGNACGFWNGFVINSISFILCYQNLPFDVFECVMHITMNSVNIEIMLMFM